MTSFGGTQEKMGQEKLGPILPNMWHALSPLLLFRLFSLFEIPEWYPKHAKALTFFFALVFMVNFMCFSQGSKVPVVSIVKPLESSVNENIMNQEISNAIQEYTKTNGDTDNAGIHHSKHDAQPTGYCVDEKKDVVALKDFLMWYVMVFMEVPHKTVHDKSVSRPRHEFHDAKSGQRY